MPGDRGELDRLLDSALASYADPSPDSGLESRILSRIAEETQATPCRRWLAWAAALPAAGIFLLIVLMPHPWAHHNPATPQQANVPHQSTPPIEAANRTSAKPGPIRRSHAPRRKERSHHKALAARSAPLPKLDIFPTPQPLSPEEQAVVKFGAHATEAERQSFLAAQQQAEAPLHIDAIQIQPLQPPAADEN